ncbi:hypothetical protein PFLU4_07780 [Pseudomonas fluorescens]|nr:hypothetical protein PFLU4_07780 [Pseudomonas fluorescens]
MWPGTRSASRSAIELALTHEGCCAAHREQALLPQQICGDSSSVFTKIQLWEQALLPQQICGDSSSVFTKIQLWEQALLPQQICGDSSSVFTKIQLWEQALLPQQIRGEFRFCIRKDLWEQSLLARRHFSPLSASFAQQPQPIEHHQQTHPHVGEHRHPHGGEPGEGEPEEDRLDHQR